MLYNIRQKEYNAQWLNDFKRLQQTQTVQEIIIINTLLPRL